MKIRDRIGLTLVVILLLGLIAWWLYYVPYTPMRLYRAMPSNVGALSAHRALPERWEDLAANPLARSLFRSMDADPDEVAAITQDPMLAALLEQLAGKDVVLGYVPSLGPARTPAWVASSWIGGKSNHLRWLAPMLEVEGLERLPDQGGHPVWSVGEDAFDGGLQPAVSLLEGMLICCWSSDPGAMQDVLDCYDGRRPSAASAFGDDPRVAWLLQNEAPDRGWVLPTVVEQGTSGTGDLPVFFAFETLAERRIQGRLLREMDFLASSAGTREPVAADDLARLLGDLPLAVASLRADLAELALAEWPSVWSEAFTRAVAETDAPHVAAALLGGEFSGRVKGIRIPSLVLAIQTSDRDACMRAVNSALDRLNAEYRLGAILRGTGSGDVFRIDVSREHPYGRLADGERAGIALTEDWLVLSSSSSALERLVQRYAAAGAAADKTSLSRVSPSDEGAAASAWIDLEKGGKTAKLALTAYSLKLIFSGSDQADETLASINEVKAWIDALSLLENGRMVLHEEDGQAELEFNVGP